METISETDDFLKLKKYQCEIQAWMTFDFLSSMVKHDMLFFKASAA